MGSVFLFVLLCASSTDERPTRESAPTQNFSESVHALDLVQAHRMAYYKPRNHRLKSELGRNHVQVCPRERESK